MQYFMLLCGSDNRSKDWACENCRNWSAKDPDVCQGCYWAHPEHYDHIAMVPERRIEIAWQGEGEVKEF